MQHKQKEVDTQPGNSQLVVSCMVPISYFLCQETQQDGVQLEAAAQDEEIGDWADPSTDLHRGHQ